MMLAVLRVGRDFWLAANPAAAGRRREALQEHFGGGAGGGDAMMALLWMVAVLALGVLVLVIFERHRRARSKPNPKKLRADLLAAEGLDEAQQRLLGEIAIAGHVEPPTLLLFSEAILRSTSETYVRRAPTDADGARRRAACDALVGKLFGASPPPASSLSRPEPHRPVRSSTPV